MPTYTLDKIASVTKNLHLPNTITVSDTIIATEGAVIIVEVLEDKAIYNQLELVSGRMSTIQKGDIIAVALGNRRALKGFVGNVPTTLHTGDVIQVLNMGGVAGICISENIKEVGHALQIKVLGAAMQNGQPLNIKQGKLFNEQDHLLTSAPLIVVSGTCMNVGKTSVASAIIKYATRQGLTMVAAKLAGVAALKDTEHMRDHGAKQVLSFIDAGYTSTAKTDQVVAVTKGAIQSLSQAQPDFIVIEFGDGILGEYGVLTILQDREIQQQIVAQVGCAHDPAGAMKLAELCQTIGAPLNMLSGPVTDNSVGVSFINRELHLPAFNSLTQGEELYQQLWKLCLQPSTPAL